MLKRMTSAMTSALNAPKTAEQPALTQRQLVSRRPVPRTLAHWCLIAFLVMLCVTTVWLAAVGSALSRSAQRVAEASLRMPTLGDYLAAQPGGKPAAPEMIAPLTPGEVAAINPPAVLGKLFESIRQFENARAEFRLAKMKAVLSGVVPASPAALAGLQRGDEIVSISGKPAGFIWEFFLAFGNQGTTRAEVEFKRGDTLYRTALSSPTGASLELANVGMNFELPEGVRYLGPEDARRLADEFMRGYVESIPAEWRKNYVASLDHVMRALARRADDQKARSSQDPAFLRSDLILVWHHEAFVAEIERLRAESSASTKLLAAQLASLGRAVAAAATFGLLALIAQVFKTRGRERLRVRR